MAFSILSLFLSIHHFMVAYKYKFRTAIFLSLLIILISACSNYDSKIKILSCWLRDRIVLTDGLIMKKVLFLAFKVNAESGNAKPATVYGIVSYENQTIAESSIRNYEGEYGYLIFDFPYEIPKGTYHVEIGIRSDDNSKEFTDFLSIDRSELKSSLEEKEELSDVKLKEIQLPVEIEKFEASDLDKDRGCPKFIKAAKYCGSEEKQL